MQNSAYQPAGGLTAAKPASSNANPELPASRAPDAAAHLRFIVPGKYIKEALRVSDCDFTPWLCARVDALGLLIRLDYIIRKQQNGVEHMFTPRAAVALLDAERSPKYGERARSLANQLRTRFFGKQPTVQVSAPGDQLTRPWGPPKDELAKPDLGDADLNALFSNAHDPATRVMLRPLHEALGSGWKFTDWVQRRAGDCQLVEGKDFGIYQSGLINSERGRPRAEYWATVEAAKKITTAENTERGNAVRLFLIRFQDRFRNATPPTTLPATLDLDDPQQLWRLVQAAGAKLLAVKEANQQLLLANTALVEDVEHALIEKEVAEVKVEEVERERDELLASLDRPGKDVRLYDFFVLTRHVLGMSRAIGYEYMRRAGLIGKPQTNKWGVKEIFPLEGDHSSCGYFRMESKPFVVTLKDAAGNPIEVGQQVFRRTIMLTADRLGYDDSVDKTGGYHWLCDRIYHDERALLYRLVAMTGGKNGEFKKLFGCQVVYCRDAKLPSDPKLSPNIIRCYKPVKKRKETKYLLARQCGKNQYRGEGLTMEEALRSLNNATPASAPRANVRGDDDDDCESTDVSVTSSKQNLSQLF